MLLRPLRRADPPRRCPLLLAAALFIFPVLAGCTSSSNLQPIRHAVDPRVQIEPAAGFSASHYRTFSVFPLSWIATSTRLRNEAVEQQLLFGLRNQFEALGYRFVAPELSPDFLVTVDAANAERLPGKPKPEATLPFEMPHPAFVHPVPLASIINFSSTLLERVRWLDDVSHAYRTSEWGNWADPRLKPPVAPTPLYRSRGQGRDDASVGSAVSGVVRSLLVREEALVEKRGGPPPPRRGSYNIPQAWVIAVDGKTFDEVWAGTAAGATPESRLELSAQLLIWAAARRFPPAASHATDRVETAYGIRYQILTNDGVNYFPAVTAVGAGSPAHAAGLLAGDMLVSVAGHSMANMSFERFSDLLAREPAGPFGVSVWRAGKEFSTLLRSSGDLTDPSFRPAKLYPVTDPPALGLGW